MTSTYLQYRFYTQDLPRTLKRTAAEPVVTREAAYYKANIGNVKTVDDLLKDNRLYTYAMKAAGMSDMIQAKAFMRKVLTSDLSDPKSFARSLADTRYQQFARTFNFSKDGTVTKNLAIAQTDTQESETVGLYSEHRERSGQVAAAEVANYQDRIGKIGSVDALLADQRTLSVALEAYGLEPKYASTTTLRSVLTSDLNDPQSAANKLGGAYKDLAAAFQFGTDGQVPAGSTAQSDTALNDTIYGYYEKSGNGSSPKAAAFASNLYQASIAGITSVDDVIADPKLFNYAVTAYGLDPILQSPTTIRQVLTSDLSDPESFANKQTDARYRNLAAAFNFNADGTVKGTDGAQTEAQRNQTVNQYLVTYDDKAQAADATETAYFKKTITGVGSDGKTPTLKTVDDVLADKRVYAYLLEAYDIDPATASSSTIKKVLTSDADNVSILGVAQTDEHYKALAAALNFAKDGTVATPRAPQTDNDKLATVRLYTALLGTDATDAQKKTATAESTYYSQAINAVETVDDLIADKRLKTYVLKAYGLEKETVTDADLRKILISDSQDPKSFANKAGDTRYRDLAGAFNFTANGKAQRIPTSQAQTRNDAAKTADLYLLQTIETEAGKDNDGVRLALYFRRKAPNINTAFDVLADKALLEVARTTLGLPTTFSNLDIDLQAKIIGQKLKFADLKDPVKLDRFMTRFGILYDQANATTAQSPLLQVLNTNQQSSITPVSIGDSLLTQLQSLRLGSG